MLVTLHLLWDMVDSSEHLTLQAGQVGIVQLNAIPSCPALHKHLYNVAFPGGAYHGVPINTYERKSDLVIACRRVTLGNKNYGIYVWIEEGPFLLPEEKFLRQVTHHRGIVYFVIFVREDHQLKHVFSWKCSFMRSQLLISLAHVVFDSSTNTLHEPVPYFV
jgi:hypothetical protein